MKYSQFMCMVLCLSLLVCGQAFALGQFEAEDVSNSEKIYVKASDVVVAENGIFVLFEGNLVSSGAIHCDSSGVYIRLKDYKCLEAWKCFNCGYGSNTGSVCNWCGKPRNG